MSAPLEENVAQIKALEMGLDEQHIREALKNCNNNMQEAMAVLIPESPEDVNLISTYSIVAKQTSSSYEGDMDMGDTETHPGSGGESDRDSTTVSYSLEEDRHIDVEEETGPPSLQFQDSHEESGELSEYPPRPDGPPPRYEDIVTSNQEESLSPLPPEDPAQEVLEAKATAITENGAQSSSIEFPLTHFYELESRVHTDQWSIPYKREESLAICMVATTKMIREGELVCEGCVWRRGGRGRLTFSTVCTYFQVLVWLRLMRTVRNS